MDRVLTIAFEVTRVEVIAGLVAVFRISEFSVITRVKVMAGCVVTRVTVMVGCVVN